MHGHGGHHTGHTVVDVDDPGKAPALFLRVLPDAVDGWNLHLQTRNFRFAPERVNTPDVMGEGHAHVYVDGKKVARVYGEWFHLSGLAPGRHEIRVTLNANRHGHYAVGGAPVQAAVGIQQR